MQGNTPIPWEEKIEQAFWRGRDSRRERLNLVKMAKENPDLINASLTNMFFFKHDPEEHGDLVKPISFFDFFKVCCQFVSLLLDMISYYSTYMKTIRYIPNQWERNFWSLLEACDIVT